MVGLEFPLPCLADSVGGQAELLAERWSQVQLRAPPAQARYLAAGSKGHRRTQTRMALWLWLWYPAKQV